MNSFSASSVSFIGQIRRIPLNQIREWLVMVRTQYDEAELDELGDSLVGQGQLQSVVVQEGEDGKGFELIIGSRRLRAAKHKGLPDIEARVIQKQGSIGLLFIALTENIHRTDLNPFEEAQVFLRLMKEHKISIKDIVQGIHKPEGYVRNRLQLLSMPEEVIALIAERALSIASASSLARLPTGEAQVRLARFAAENHLTQPELHAKVRRELRESARIVPARNKLTPAKIEAQVGEFVALLRKIPRRINLREVNDTEKQLVMKALQELESEAKSLREAVEMALIVNQHSSTLDNHHQEWTTKDIKRISSSRRPSDKELSLELGRTVSAIRVMRSKIQENKG